MAGLRLSCRGEGAMYRSLDELPNFKIKVTLKKKDPLVASQKHLEQEGRDGVELETFARQQDAELDVEEGIFTWQEKHLSKREYETYQLLENCRTTLERKYHDMIKSGKTKPPRRLFSYVDADEFIKKHEDNEPITTSVENPNSFLVKKINNSRMHKFNTSDVTKITNVTHNGSRAPLLAKNQLQSMVLMADLNELDRLGSNEVHEAVLCIIQVSSNGIIYLTPDFTNGRQPYVIETENYNHANFEYTLEHASLPVSQKHKQREKEMLKKSKSRRDEMIKALVGKQFETPPRGLLKTYLFGEIVSASSFEARNLYVNYIFHLPSDWTTSDDNQQLYGTTPSCSPKYCKNINVAHFNFPFSAEFSVQNELSCDDYSWPRLFLEIWSRDFWNRFRIEGYGYVNVPFSPGTYEFEIETWCPISNSLESRLHRFFLGYGSELEGIVFSAAPLAGSKSKQAVSNLGLCTESRGKLRVRMNVIHQSLDYMSRTNGMLNLKLSVAAQPNLLTVLEAFQRARHQMLAARENIGSVEEATEGIIYDRKTKMASSVTTSLSDNLVLHNEINLGKLSVSDSGEVKSFKRKGKKICSVNDSSSDLVLNDSSERVDRSSRAESNFSDGLSLENDQEYHRPLDESLATSTSGHVLETKVLPKQKQRKKKKGREKEQTDSVENVFEQQVSTSSSKSGQVRRRKKKGKVALSRVEEPQSEEPQTTETHISSLGGVEDFTMPSAYSNSENATLRSESIMLTRSTSEFQEIRQGNLKVFSDPLPVRKGKTFIQKEETFQISSGSDSLNKDFPRESELQRKRAVSMLDKLSDTSQSDFTETTATSGQLLDSITSGMIIEESSKTELPVVPGMPKTVKAKMLFRKKSSDMEDKTSSQEASSSSQETVLAVWNRPTSEEHYPDEQKSPSRK